MPTAKQAFWSIAFGVVAVVLVNYASKKIPQVAKLTANG